MGENGRGDRIALGMFLATLAAGLFGYGVVVGRYEVFPFSVIEGVHAQLRLALTGESESWYVRQVDHERPPIVHTPLAQDGLNLVTRFVSDSVFHADILDMEGNLLHRWDTDWFEIWPDAEHLSDFRTPRSRPGTHIHGAVVLDDGDLVFNFEHLGLVRLDRDGSVVWRLPYLTHHSVHLSEEGTLWVSGQVDHDTPQDRFPHRGPTFSEYTAIEVSTDGEILGEWSIAEVLRENGLHGLLYLGTTENRDVRVGDADILHLNDVEPFPPSMEEGVFRRGDVMVSLRNINTVLVFNRDSRRVRYLQTGGFVRQHDPDFLDGNRFSVYDNNNVGPESHGQQSRIVIVDAALDKVTVHFEGGAEIPFYSDIMGKHQWLPDGNLLLTESVMGRAVEIAPDGSRAWEFVNYVRPGTVGLMEEVQRIAPEFRAVFGEGGGDPDS
jgi:hypothetical protein